MSTHVEEDPTATDLLEKVPQRPEGLLRQHDKYADAKKRKSNLLSELEDLKSRRESLLSRAADLEAKAKKTAQKAEDPADVDISDLQNEAQKLRWKAEGVAEEIVDLETEVQRVDRTIQSVEDGRAPTGLRRKMADLYKRQAGRLRAAAEELEEANGVLQEMERRLFGTAGLDFPPPNGGAIGEEAEGAVENIKRRVSDVQDDLRHF